MTTRTPVKLQSFEASTLPAGRSTTLRWRPSTVVRLSGLAWKGAHDSVWITNISVGLSSLFAGPSGEVVAGHFRGSPPPTDFAQVMTPGDELSITLRNGGGELAAELEVWGLEVAQPRPAPAAPSDQAEPSDQS